MLPKARYAIGNRCRLVANLMTLALTLEEKKQVNERAFLFHVLLLEDTQEWAGTVVAVLVVAGLVVDAAMMRAGDGERSDRCNGARALNWQMSRMVKG